MKACFVLFSLLCWVVVFSGCKKNETKVSLGNLVVEKTIAADGSGLVSFQATADNAVKFTFYFGEGLDAPADSPSGIITHTYLTSGTYSARIVAYSVDNASIDKTVGIIIQVNEPPISSAGYTTPESYSGMTLVWQDEFNDGHLNTSDWNYETGPFNDELEYYKEENTSVQDGYLIIKAKVEKIADKIYSSSRLTTQGKKAFQFGRVDIRAVVPKGQGLFPALWMLGSSFSTVGWPQCGEIDIMETICGGGRDSVVYGTAHWADSTGKHVSYGGHKGLQDGHILGDEFHVYSIVWNSTSIKWYIDDVQYHIIDITPNALSELRSGFFFIFNVAVGGGWAGPPDATTVFPQRMVVDYVRVFQ